MIRPGAVHYAGGFLCDVDDVSSLERISSPVELKALSVQNIKRWSSTPFPGQNALFLRPCKSMYFCLIVSFVQATIKMCFVQSAFPSTLVKYTRHNRPLSLTVALTSAVTCSLNDSYSSCTIHSYCLYNTDARIRFTFAILDRAEHNVGLYGARRQNC